LAQKMLFTKPRARLWALLRAILIRENEKLHLSFFSVLLLVIPSAVDNLPSPQQAVDCPYG
jgi:hypothetical protein